MSNYKKLSSYCYGCTILPNEKITVSDNQNKKLIVVNKEGKVEDEMVLQTYSIDITNLVKHNLVAVHVVMTMSFL